MKISFICISNDNHKLDAMLLNSYNNMVENKELNVETNILIIRNDKGTYKSASEAYNVEVQKHLEDLGNILVFIHQDIAFDNNEYWVRLLYELRKDNNQLLGAAGTDRNGLVLSNLRYFKDRTYITGYQIKEKTEVLSLDECCIAISKKLFLKLYFDEKICDNWHLYGVDLCYSAREQFGATISVLPEEIYHKESKGGLSVDKHYLDTLWKVSQKHRPYTDRIYTTCYNIKTNPVLAGLDIARYRLRIFVRSLLKVKKILEEA